MDNSTQQVEIQNDESNTLIIFNSTKAKPLIPNKTSNLNNTQIITNNTSSEKPFKNNNNDTIFNNTNYNQTTQKSISNSIENSNPLLVNNVEGKLGKSETNYLILYIEIMVPIFLILLIILIYCCIKKRIKSKSNKVENDSLDRNKIHGNNSGNKQPYNRIQNTSGFNVGLNTNNLSMSEIKVQNLKDEIHNIITNNSGGSNSSGKRKREKRKQGNNNKMNFSSQEKNKGIQNEIKEEIKQYVIDEHLNNS
jgi:hypothetical protein